jgi:hypothetical protein
MSSKGQWRIPVNGDWFYGTKEQCERERAEYESTFTDLDREEAGVVVPEQIYSGAPPELAELQAAIATLEAENKRLRLVEEVWKLQKDMPSAMVEALDEIDRLKSGQGEPVALRFVWPCGKLGNWYDATPGAIAHALEDVKRGVWKRIDFAYASQPAPILGDAVDLLRDIQGSHGVMLMSYPPQDPWLNNRIDERIKGFLDKVKELNQ